MSDRNDRPPSTTSPARKAFARRMLLPTAVTMLALTGLGAVRAEAPETTTVAAAAPLVHTLAGSRAIRFVPDEAALTTSSTSSTSSSSTTSSTAAPTTTTTVRRTTTSTAPAAPAPAPAPAPQANGDPNDPATWDRLAQCESGGRWALNSGNGYYGGLQFSLSTWQNVGGTGYPHEHPRETQIEMGKRLYNAQGWSAWPSCSRQLGYR